MQPEAVMAIDLGASSGRCMLARYDGKALVLNETHRFPNRPIRFNGHLRWNVGSLFEEIKTGLAAAAHQRAHVRSLGVDTWGVDFALLGPGDVLLDLPVSYRDESISGSMEAVCEALGRDRIYAETGIQFLPFNTLYQLYSRKRQNEKLLQFARRLLMMPDLFAFLLGGVSSGERTNASTTQMLSARTGQWSELLTSFLSIDASVLPSILRPGTPVSELRGDVAAETGLTKCKVIATATHDTASAIAGIPAQEEAWAYISCGTWSLVGQEVDAPLVSASALAGNFTNEAGVADTTRFLKNIQGMWLLQECQREWAARGNAVNSGELVRGASKARPFAYFVDPDDPTLLQARSMLESIKAFCVRTDQKFDAAPGAVARAVFESLALKHRRTIASLVELTGVPVKVIHIVGGGSRNRLLCQWTADATGLHVVAGPTEATAIGNAAVQGIALGWFADLASARQAIAASVHLADYIPRKTNLWEEAEQRFSRVLEKQPPRAVHA